MKGIVANTKIKRVIKLFLLTVSGSLLKQPTPDPKPGVFLCQHFKPLIIILHQRPPTPTNTAQQLKTHS